MANIKIQRKEFEKYFKINKETEEKIALFGIPVESVTDEDIEMEIFPNRPDLLSLQGFVRGFSAFLGKKTGLKEYKVNSPLKDYEVDIDSSLKNIRPFTACAIVKNLKFNDEKIKEIIDIQEKIHNTLGRKRKKIAIGIYPLEQITLPIKFTAKNPKEIKFLPLESEREMTGEQILRQHPTGREYAHLLKDYEKFPVFIDGNNEILSMPPIINSNKTGKITEKTKDIFIECSGFDFNILNKTLNILVTMLSDMGGEIYQMKIKPLNKNTPDLTPEKMKINLENINKLLGLELKEKEISNLLEKMGHNYNPKLKQVEIPAYRTDILHEVDIAEDIAIAYGYDKFIPSIPEIATSGKIDNKNIIKGKISTILTNLSLLELKTHHLLTKEDLKKSKLKPELEVEKSKTDFKYLRAELLSSILKVLSENVDSEYPQKIFEIGTVFKRDEKEETQIKETDKLCIALTPGNFTEIKQILNYLGKMLNLAFDLEEAIENNFIEGRTGKILLDKKSIGIIGEIYPTTLKNCHLKLPLSVLELDLEEIYKKLT